MSDCDCSPLPTVSCDPQSSPQPECGRIRMFFGYDQTKNGKPGELNKLYYTDPQNNDSISKGFKIVGYSAQSLIDSGILKSLDPFILTEAELLASETWQGWLTFSADWRTQSLGGGLVDEEPFGIRCMKSLGVDMTQFETDALKMFASLKNGDTSAFFGILYKSINMPIDNAKWGEYFKDPDPNDCDNLKRGLLIEKLKICWEWFKNIQETYYGKQFLVKVSGPKENDVFPGVCIKDEDGNSPIFNVAASGAFYIEGDGSSQGYYTSDEIVDGGFPKQYALDLLGLTKVDWVQNTDGKIGAFVKIGQISDSNNSTCDDMPNRKIYYKFTNHLGSCVAWIIDLSKLDINNYYIDKNGSYETLYMKCGIENRFYVDKNGTWVNITLNEQVPLTPQIINPIQGIVNFVLLLLGTYKAVFYNFLNKFDGVSGSRGNSSQLNLALAKPPCLIPQGVVIPFKSNVYNYGPYYYVTDPDEGGGIDVIKENTIAPWNFIKPGEFEFPVSYPYCAMDKFGKELAKLSPKGLQKLEKGRANVVGLPCRGIGESLDSGYDTNKEIGPTLLTDISVDYGSSGFNTTYNFSTYSPRLGKSEKYLLDAWSHNIENTKYISSYLRNEKAKVEDIKKGYTKKLIDKNYYFNKQGGPKVKEKSTPNRLMFSGYYFTQEDNSIPSSSNYVSPNDIFEPLSSCGPSSSPNEELTGDVAIEYVGSGTRRYTFSETDQAYSAQYIQNTYFQLAGMSLDGFYLPISLRGVNNSPSIDEYTKDTDNNLTKNSEWQNAGRLPRFAMRCEFDEQFIEWDTKNDSDLKKTTDPGYPIPSKTRDEIPPFFMKIKNSDGDIVNLNCYLLPIHQRYLNPFTTKNMLDGLGADDFDSWDDRKGDSTKGFVISSIVFGQNHMDYQISHTNESNIINGLEAKHTDEYIRQQYHNFRVPSLRGPLVLQGWGYDTTGKPIPNSADRPDNAELGQFKKSQLTDKFSNNWLQNPKMWPVGPVDLRFDRERGVWTCPSPNKIIVARLKEDLVCGGSAKAELINPEAGGIRFYEKYHISGPNGEDVKLNMSKTEITVYNFLGEEEIEECSKIYVYYDDNRYIVLRADKSTPPTLRFRAIKLCKNSEDPSEHYKEDTWGAFAGYGDKYHNYHIYGIRIDCDGNPIDKYSKSLPLEENEELNDKFTEEFIKNNAANWLIKLQDNAGKFGPSYAHFEDYDTWKEKAATGYALRAINKESQSCDNNSISESPSPSPSASPPCSLGETSNCESPLDEAVDNKLKIYDIIFIESYARFLHGCLTEDLYPTQTGLYSGIEYKQNHLYGNAAIDPSGLVFYGDAPNGREPIYLDSEYKELPIRVFDPWIKDENGELKDIDCYTRVDSIFYNATSGTPFTAIFNEKDKKYYIWQINKKEELIIRFRLIKLCANNKDLLTDPEDTCPPSNQENTLEYYEEDTWGSFAGYGDKYYNFHTYAIRIDCDGNAIDQNYKKIPENQEFTERFIRDNADDWLVKLQDNAGKFGPSYSDFIDYENWKNKAATGYAVKIRDVINPSPNTQCELGETSPYESIILDPEIDNRLKNYDIIFLESYARFVECKLTQDLYVTYEQAFDQYSDDEYKTAHPEGNAAADIIEHYGDSPNGKEPKFFKDGGDEIPFRIFDPFMDAPEDKNPFRKLKCGDKVLVIFNEKLKKYLIWQSIKQDQDTIVKFALVQDKNIDDVEATAVLVDQFGRPIDNMGELLTEENFIDNLIQIRDPFLSRSSLAPDPNGTLIGDLMVFGPALGGETLDHHYNGIQLEDCTGASGIGPFIGFAVKRMLKNNEPTPVPSPSQCSTDPTETIYEMFTLEHYAEYVYGKICTKTANFDLAGDKYYLAAKAPSGYRNGINPIARQTQELPRGDLIIHHSITQFDGVHSYIIGDLKSGGGETCSYDNTDGCSFIAKLDAKNSTTDNLIYKIVESERVALFGKIKFNKQDKADKLNKNDLNLKQDETNDSTAEWGQGFMWDAEDSIDNIDKIKILNRDEWINKGLFIENSVVTVTLTDIDEDGNLIYSVVNGGTIARVVQKSIVSNPGLFGHPSYSTTDRKIGTDAFFDGLDPSSLQEDKKPKIDLVGEQQWMTYSSGLVTGLWDETASDQVQNCIYKVIYAQEAPIILTGTANSEFKPEQSSNISITVLYSSSQGYDKQPVTILLTKIDNPMGHGAKPGDLVDVQRVWTNTPQNGANYKYIVIGTGNPPGALKQ